MSFTFTDLHPKSLPKNYTDSLIINFAFALRYLSGITVTDPNTNSTCPAYEIPKQPEDLESLLQM